MKYKRTKLFNHVVSERDTRMVENRVTQAWPEWSGVVAISTDVTNSAVYLRIRNIWGYQLRIQSAILRISNQ